MQNFDRFQFLIGFPKTVTYHHGGLPTWITQHKQLQIGRYCTGRKRWMHWTREYYPCLHRRSVAFSRGDIVRLPQFFRPYEMATFRSQVWTEYESEMVPNGWGGFFYNYREEWRWSERSRDASSLFLTTTKIRKKITKNCYILTTTITNWLLNPKACNLQNLLLTH